MTISNRQPLQHGFAERWTREMEPALTAMSRVQLDLVRRIDTLLCHPPSGVKLARRQKQTLSRYLLSLVDQLLAADESDAELEAVHDRHSDTSRAEQREMECEFTHAMLEEVFGEDVVATFEGGDSESLLRHAQAKLTDAATADETQRQQRAAERAAKRGKPTAAELAAERKTNAAQKASLSLGEIFRKLVSALHPDREADSAERERKTALMKRVNREKEPYRACAEDQSRYPPSLAAFPPSSSCPAGSRASCLNLHRSFCRLVRASVATCAAPTPNV